MTTDITTVEMTIAEESRLVQLEEVVDKGLDGFIEVGLALTEIRDRRLYRQTHGTFDEYLSDRFGISRSRGYQYIDAARVSTVVDIQNERQARALSGLDDQQAREVYEVAVAKMNGTPTAKAITEAKAEVTGGGRPAKPTAGSRMPTSKVYTDPNNFINALASHGESTVIQVDRLDWSRLDHDAIPEYLQNIKLTIAVLRKLQAQVTLAAQGGE